MLDNPHQLAAYKLLQASGIHKAASITLAGTISAEAATKAAAVAALHVTTITYPDTIAAQVTLLTTWAALLTRVKTVCDTFVTHVTPYQEPTDMIQLYNGWEVYKKVNALPDDQDIRTNAAVGDTTVVAGLKTALDAIDTGTLATAWGIVNTALTPAPVTPPATATTPTLTQQQITDLGVAMTKAGVTFDALKTATDAVETLGNNAKADADVSNDAFSRAVSVAILTNITSNGMLTDSVKAILPANVFSEIQAATTNN
ncbi:TPA: hypothetical protein I9Y37_001846 [Citrobacter freundii]|nr:hypothetical protein [Citrobacter freundii]HAT3963824.1 hypothetical protein [Citrobacter freundii]